MPQNVGDGAAEAVTHGSPPLGQVGQTLSGVIKHRPAGAYWRAQTPADTLLGHMSWA
jgi:hypothetical protein